MSVVSRKSRREDSHEGLDLVMAADRIPAGAYILNKILKKVDDFGRIKRH